MIFALIQLLKVILLTWIMFDPPDNTFRRNGVDQLMKYRERMKGYE